MKNTLFVLLLSFSVSIGYGQTDRLIPRLYLPSKNTPYGASNYIFTNANTNNSNTDYWQMINNTSKITSKVMNFANYNNISLKIGAGTYGAVGTNNTITIQYSTDNVNWTNVSTILPSSSSNSLFSISLPNTTYNSMTSYIRLTTLNANGANGARVFSIVFLGTKVSSLPVELSMFRGEEQYLLWTTQSETQNKGWEVERSIDGKAWTNIGFVEGFGNSYQKLDYHFELKEFGKYYYKLKQLDFDGHYEYSPIAFLDNSNLIQEGKMYIDLSGRETTNPKTNTMYIIPNKGKVMYIER
jgi:hypothetical protein